LEETIDTVKTGDPNQKVTGIVTTFQANMAVIQKTISLGANFIITHEPTFYSHLDDVSGLKNNTVYRTKRKLIDDHGIVIWRFHDYWHRHQPDGIMMGLISTLGWESYLNDGKRPVFTLPETTVGNLITTVKNKLGCKTVRVVGDPDIICSSIALSPGSPGPEWQMALLDDDDIDVLLTGEVHEWEIAEFARDAVLQGRQKALVLLGHANSEEAGMAYLVDWLRPKFPQIDLWHVPVGDAFQYM
jgi:putative NIF3 family GTP cyclohydrolase 1 type 2